MPKYDIEFTPRASAQMRNIFSYIAEDSPHIALKTVDKIESRVNLLKTNQNLGTELSESDFPFLTPGYRRLIVKPFIVYYRVINTEIFITHVVHERQEQGEALR
jgi:toxin ParE1/3/4